MTDQKPGCLGAILKIFGLMPSQKSEQALPYGLRDDFVSPAELSFYKALNQAVDGKAVICPKVSLKDVFFVKRPDQNRTYLNKIDRKHVDFLLCKTDTLRPIAGIELDDKSHMKADRADRDRFVDEVFKTASLPLVRFVVQREYSKAEIMQKLNAIANATIEPSTMTVNQSATDDAPTCPKCGIPMVLRTAKQGTNAGISFYGCSNFPKCREVVEKR